MARSIKVFIRGEWVVKPFSSNSSVWVWASWTPEHRFEKFVSKDEVLALKMATEVAEECGLDVKVYDVANLRGWIFAHVKGVKVTPTIIINNHWIEGLPSRDEILRIIEHVE